MITENLSTLKIHKLTQAQYDRELEAGNIDENALYLTPDEENIVVVKTSRLTNVADLSRTEINQKLSEGKIVFVLETINNAIYTYSGQSSTTVNGGATTYYARFTKNNISKTFATSDSLYIDDAKNVTYAKAELSNDTKADADHTHDDYAPKASPVFTGSISLGRKPSTTIGSNSMAIGSTVTASGSSSHAEGQNTIASGSSSHAEGHNTVASGHNSHAGGSYTTASGYFSHAGGYYTTAQRDSQTAIGRYNVLDTDGAYNGYSAKADALIIGNGSSSSRSNAFRVVFNGKAYGGTYSSSGADYAEYFEWADGNPDNEDRIGLFVTLTNGGYIKIAQPEDDILGVVSGNGSVIGDSYDDTWHGMWMRDVYGRLLYEDVEVEHEDENGEKYTVVEHRMKLNPDYNPDEEYIPRSERKEWDAIGMFGKLVLNDDGSCVVGSYCSCGANGIATSSETGYRVMARLDDSHVRILVK